MRNERRGTAVELRQHRRPCGGRTGPPPSGSRGKRSLSPGWDVPVHPVGDDMPGRGDDPAAVMESHPVWTGARHPGDACAPERDPRRHRSGARRICRLQSVHRPVSSEILVTRPFAYLATGHHCHHAGRSNDGVERLSLSSHRVHS